MKKILMFTLLLLLTGCNFSSSKDIKIELQPGHDVITMGSSWVDGGCVLVDNTIRTNMSTSDTVDTTVPNETIIHYSLNYYGTDYTCVRVVKVVDDIPPTITLNPGVDTVQVGDVWVDAGVTVADNYAISTDATVEGNVDTSTIGIYEVIYTAIDDAGNKASVVRVVHVINSN